MRMLFLWFFSFLAIGCSSGNAKLDQSDMFHLPIEHVAYRDLTRPPGPENMDGSDYSRRFDNVPYPDIERAKVSGNSVRWIAYRGMSLRFVLDAWTSSKRQGAASSGWRPVVWNTGGFEKDAILTTNIDSSNFMNALNLLSTSVYQKGSVVHFQVRLYRRQNLIVVTSDDVGRGA